MQVAISITSVLKLDNEGHARQHIFYDYASIDLKIDERDYVVRNVLIHKTQSSKLYHTNFMKVYLRRTRNRF